MPGAVRLVEGFDDAPARDRTEDLRIVDMVPVVTTTLVLNRSFHDSFAFGVVREALVKTVVDAGEGPGAELVAPHPGVHAIGDGPDFSRRAR